ncbi:hypothetical protein HYG81_16195 [Natrinema zhouii]|uniref:Uncharacterized protein n=1 Tax=Natrinema zhouii TaxID=1710539 RepID=A0A7D6GQZ7_9EURY|nr:hypothetical protein [Natrinema zhouii]QLK25603.1 hypothetical protein HYG81_16195 [Natrinema zhouii]
MKTVEDDTGKRYLLRKRSDTASLVRDPETGNECYIQNDRLKDVDEASALETAARSVSDPVLTLLTNVHDEETVGLLIELSERGPLAARTLLDTYDFCESNLHGRLTILSAAGLLEEADVAGERGYRITEDCKTALETIRPNIEATDEKAVDRS